MANCLYSVTEASNVSGGTLLLINVLLVVTVLSEQTYNARVTCPHYWGGGSHSLGLAPIPQVGGSQLRERERPQVILLHTKLFLLVAPFGHLVVDGSLHEAVRAHVGCNLIQGLEGSREKALRRGHSQPVTQETLPQQRLMHSLST